MECKKCGEKLKNGLLFCPNCGAEIRYVPDYNILEEDILDSYIGEDPNAQAAAAVRNQAAQPAAEERKRIPSWLVPVLALSVAAVIGIVMSVTYFGRADSPEETEQEVAVYSYDYYVQQGQVYVREGNYAQALTLFDTALKLKPGGIEALENRAACYLALGQPSEAEEAYLELVDMTENNASYITALIDLYEQQGRFDHILSLAEKTKDPEILERIKSFQVLPPTFSVEGGTYSDTVTVEIESEKGTNILYTLDGSDPKTDGLTYQEAVVLSKEGVYDLAAVCYNDSGLYSEEVKATYEIAFPTPGEPVPSIPSGEYLIEQTVSFSVPSGCNAYYTWDGSDPTSASTPYSGPIYLMAGNHVLSVVYISSHGKAGPIARFSYTLYTEEQMVG